ncbi:hypothetical protein BH18THE2_BH18THE2_34060 [soil metagenome]
MKNSTSFNLGNLTIRDLSKGISSGDVSPVDLVEVSLQRITRLNPKLNAFITVLENSAKKMQEMPSLR